MTAKKKRRGKIRSLTFWNGNGEKKKVFCRVFDGKTSLAFHLVLDQYLIITSEKGVPWNCLLARGCKKHKDAFPHKMFAAFAVGGLIYIQSTEVTRAGQVPTMIRYKHNFGKALRKFDQFSREGFLRLFGDQGVEIELSPPPKSSRQTGGERGEHDRTARDPTRIDRAVARGAYRRALDAGLLQETRDA